MTISTLVVKNSYNGDGSATQFAYQFPIHSTSEIKVIERSAGNCKMRINTHSVISPLLEGHGVDNLRVCDASIMSKSFQEI